MDEQVKAEITGHCSNAIRGYKRTSEVLKKDANSIVSGASCCKMQKNEFHHYK